MSDDSKTKGPGTQTIRKEPEGSEPVFTIDLDAPQEDSLNASADDAQLQQEISRLQSQIHDIVKSPDPDALTSNQAEVLRKYILLKETESQDLKDQQKQYQAYVRNITSRLQTLTHKNRDLITELETFKSREEASRLGAQEIEKRHREELVRMKNEYDDQQRRAGNVSHEYEQLQRRREEWKEKVQGDLKRIKLKERELENKYELLKRDTQALLDSKDKHVIELKRKNDALELEMESLEERLRGATLAVSTVQSKKRRLIETLKLAISLLEQMDHIDVEEENPQKKTG